MAVQNFGSPRGPLGRIPINQVKSKSAVLLRLLTCLYYLRDYSSFRRLLYSHSILLKAAVISPSNASKVSYLNFLGVSGFSKPVIL